MHNRKDFLQIQQQFAAHIRDPEQPVPEGVEQRRMAVYNELIFNNIDGFIANAFPVLREISSDADWQDLIRDFMIKHRCQTPLFHQIAEEFLHYLQQERNHPDDPTFITELAHYEWVELALSVADDTFQPYQVGENEDCMQLSLQSAPLASMLTYQYPVHQIGPDFQPDAPGDIPTYLLVYRDSEEQVIFIELNPVSARLMALLDAGNTGQQAAQQIADEIKHNNPQQVVEAARNLITDWLQRGVLI